ncbi:MlaD family protein [Patulibacter medicamentivorans]|uniref:MlaD family protein n=1 Tax=Patulibacter medicamentivorans TaxID=1097667 RepID=UPI0002F3A985|nr:MlaD family protein [Patulibacter medicamentivorans]
MSRRTKPRPRRDASRWYPLAGFLGILVCLAILYVGFTANSGLPAASTYEIVVDVPNANRMVKNNQVRIGGVRVGQVSKVEAIVPPRGVARPSFARLHLMLDGDVAPLPVDTAVKVRPASVLGATYVDLMPGRSRRTVPSHGTLSIANARSTVEITDLLDLFDPRTARNLQRGVGDLGVALAGRGSDLGTAISELSRVSGPLARLMRTLAAPETRLGPLLDGYARTVAAFDAVSGDLGGLVASGSRTFAALARERGALTRTLDVLPGSATATTRALARLRPALDDLAMISTELRPASALLPAALRDTRRTFDDGVSPARLLPAFSRPLQATLRSLERFARLPQADGTVRKLDDAFQATGKLLEKLTPAQVHCNVLSVWGRNMYEAFGTAGTGAGPSVGIATIKALGNSPLELLQNRDPLPNLHVNYNPTEDARECEGGNEPYSFTSRSLASPPGRQSTAHVETLPPPGVPQLAARARLLDTPPGER